MIEFFKQVYSGALERVRSPLAFSILLSLLIWNWRSVLVIFFSDYSVFVRILLVEKYSDLHHSLIYPVSVGFSIGIAWQFLSLIGAWFAKFPKFLIYKIDQSEVTRREGHSLHVAAERLKNKADFERARAELEERQEVEIIKRGERLQRASETNEATEKEILDSRRVNSTDASAWVLESDAVHVSGRYVLHILAEATESLSRSEIADMVLKSLSSEDRKIFETLMRLEVEIGEALRRFLGEQIVNEILRAGEKNYILTSKGYKLRDQVLEFGEIL